MKSNFSVPPFAPHIGFLFLILIATATQCPKKSAYVATAPRLDGVFRLPDQYIPHNLGGEYKALPANFIIVRLNEGGLPQRKITVDGDTLESITNDPATIARLDGLNRGYWWTEKIGSDYVDVKIFAPKSKRNGPRYAVGITNLSSSPPPGSNGYSSPLYLSISSPAANTITEPSEVFFDCGDDYDAIDGRWHYNCQHSSSIISKNIVVAGWLIEEPYVNSAPHGTEDIFFNTMLDVDFMNRMYGPGGSYNILSNAALPGNPPNTNQVIMMADRDENSGASRGVNFNSFSLPLGDGNNVQSGTNIMYLHGELNCWHENASGSTFGRHFVGRGKAPAGWSEVNLGHTDSWWPYDPRSPSNGLNDGLGLHKGDYVIMKGTLWQDAGHLNKDWLLDCSDSHNGWIELHPIDWIEKPGNRYAAKSIGIASHYYGYNCPTGSANSGSDESTVTITIIPDEQIMPKPNPNAVLNFSELIDGRFTDMNSVIRHDGSVVNNQLQVTIGVRRRINGASYLPGKFKAGYLLWWE